MKLRVKKPLNNASILVKCGETILRKIKHFVLIPSEMIIMKVKCDEKISQDIFVEVQENE